MYFKNPESSQ